MIPIPFFSKRGSKLDKKDDIQRFFYIVSNLINKKYWLYSQTRNYIE